MVGRELGTRQGMRGGRSWLSAGIVAAVVAAALLVLAAGLVVRLTAVTADQFWSDVVRALLTIAGGVVLTGVVGVAVNRLRDRELAARQDAAFIEGQIVELWAAREQVMRAAVLIAAHRTAKTYGEQLREIIRVRTQLVDVQGVVERYDGELDGLDQQALRQQIATALGFLNPLVDEYRDSYKEISARQSVDEARNRVAYGEGRWERPSRSAWNELQRAERFPQLNKLIHVGNLAAGDYTAEAEAYRSACLTLELLDPIALAVRILRSRTPETRAATEQAIADHTSQLQEAAGRCGRAGPGRPPTPAT